MCYSKCRQVRVLAASIGIGLCLNGGVGYCSDVAETVRRDALVASITNALMICTNMMEWPASVPRPEQALTNDNDSVRWMTVSRLGIFGRGLQPGDLRRRYVVSLLAGQLGDRLGSARTAVRKLLFFKPEDFDDDAKRKISVMFNNETNRLKETILLVGMLDMKEENAVIAEWAKSRLPPDNPETGGYFSSQTWNALLVMARRGDKESFDRLVRANETELHPGDKVRNIDDFIYVHRPEMVRYMAKYLDSKERSAPLVKNMPGGLIAYNVAQLMGCMLEGFPIKSFFQEIKEEDLQKCKEWVDAQKEFKYRVPVNDWWR